MKPSNNSTPAWVTQGKTIRQLIQELQSFEDQDMEVRLSLDNGESHHCVSMVAKGFGNNSSEYCVLSNAEVDYQNHLDTVVSISHLDHLVLTVNDIDKTVRFYQQVLGMNKIEFAGGRVALTFGQQKINLHQKGNEFEPKAGHVMPGSADLCFITHTPLHDAAEHLKVCGVVITEGPIRRTGATGPIESIYCRDPDNNLIEIANAL